MGEAQSWRELLGSLTDHPAERQRVADVLGVTPYTITRWVTGESEPRLRSLKRLPDVFPNHRQRFWELLQAELNTSLPFPPSPEYMSGAPAEVPSEFLTRALATYATMGGPFGAWSLRQLTLQQIVTHLDPDQQGVRLMIVQCVPPTEQEVIRSLVAVMSIGTSPWESGIKQQLIFIGNESLSGWTVSRAQPGIVHDIEQEYDQRPMRWRPEQRSAAAWPFLRQGKIAGCLYATSTQSEFFTSFRLQFLEVYANILALSFHDHAFYPVQYIRLHYMPSLGDEEQLALLTRYRTIITQIRQDHNYQKHEYEVEILAQQQLEQEILSPMTQKERE